ncbi:helix-turn-helix domain-containing protein [Bacillaceae bacterium S4-13-58]
MIENLKNLFPSLIIQGSDELKSTGEEYEWFELPDHTIIGIANSDLSKSDKLLLSTFLKKYRNYHPNYTKNETQWWDLLYNLQSDKELTKFEEVNSFRFVFFSLSDGDIDVDTFKEALKSLFAKDMPVLWENEGEGIIIEEFDETSHEPVSYDAIVDILMSDFFIKIKIYISEMFYSIDQGYSSFQWAKKCYRLSLSTVKKDVATHIDVIPYLFLNSIDAEDANFLYMSIFREVEDDPDLLKTIQIFLECNSNATLAAKKLYMHRNSLQYRVDKFVEKTGIDVKQFRGAMTTYLALLIGNLKGIR